MEGNEKLIEALKNVDVKALVTPEPVFPKEAYEMFKRNGLSSEEIATLENAELKTRIMNLLPDDEKGQERLAMALQAISRSGKENAANLITIAQKDPAMLVQLMALTEVFKSAEERIIEENKK
ncbi:MAG: hypothetical protein IJ310_03550 [Clostridia bacterium]|nr:hypothetical protein [Clostridia bacterium]